MKIISDFSGDYQDGYNTALKIEEFSDDGNAAFFYGIQCGIDKKHLRLHREYPRKILLDLWSPCAFFSDPDHFSILEGFDEVYSICPYTTEWTNRKLGKNLMKYCFYPVSPRVIEPEDKRKTYDVCYVGGIYSPEHQSTIDIVSRHRYVFVTQGGAKKATHRRLSNADKMKLVGKSRIGICFNKLYLDDGHFSHLTRYDDWQSNKAFTNVRDPIPIAPQIKTRLHEYALSKTLILVHRDPWNVVEDYYEPGKDFLYFDDVADLKALIPAILSDWGAYSRIVESAYEKVHDYSTENLVRMVRNGDAFGRRNVKDGA